MTKEKIACGAVFAFITVEGVRKGIFWQIDAKETGSLWTRDEQGRETPLSMKCSLDEVVWEVCNSFVGGADGDMWRFKWAEPVNHLCRFGCRPEWCLVRKVDDTSTIH